MDDPLLGGLQSRGWQRSQLKIWSRAVYLASSAAKSTKCKILGASRRGKLAQLAGAPERTSHVGTIEIFAQVHEREESAEDSGFQIIGERQAAGGDAGQALAMFGDEFHDFALAFVRCIAQGRLAAHARATVFHRQSEMQYAHQLLTQSS